jgi:hypothetical protein
MAKRGYSREFTPADDNGKNYLLFNVPAALWRDVKRKAKSEGKSVRAAILTRLKAWVEEVQP